MRQSMTCIAMMMAVLTLGFGEPERLEAQMIIVGHDYGGSDLLPANNDILSGVFTNVGTFRIAAGTTVSVDPGEPLSITADEIIIAGTLDGIGAGNLGGDHVDNFQTLNCTPTLHDSNPGVPGVDAGGGGGGLFGCAFDGSGGGGGGYGGAGGQSGGDNDTAPAAGGIMVGDANTASIEMGAGGGSGSRYDFAFGNSGAGGSGGGAISLFGPLDLSGSIVVNGTSGLSGLQPLPLDLGTSAGGGGSGGGVLLDSGPNGSSLLNGSISAVGGAGGNGGPEESGSGGGGGGGGRIKLFGTAELGADFSYDVSGGSPGISAPSRTSPAATERAGGDGTFFNATTLPSIDADGDGVDDADDVCPDTVIPESVPTVRLGVNRFALVDDDGSFDTTAPGGKGPRKAFTIQDTAGCSCEQIIARLGLGQGHTKFGCSIGAMQTWIDSLN